MKKETRPLRNTRCVHLWKYCIRQQFCRLPSHLIGYQWRIYGGLGSRGGGGGSHPSLESFFSCFLLNFNSTVHPPPPIHHPPPRWRRAKSAPAWVGLHLRYHQVHYVAHRYQRNTIASKMTLKPSGQWNRRLCLFGSCDFFLINALN